MPRLTKQTQPQKRVTFVFIRHSKSCSNLTGDESLTDPDLTVNGARTALAYGPRLVSTLKRRGINYKDARNVLLGNSGLLRASRTAELLFPHSSVTTLPHIRKDNPRVPRDAPALFRDLYTRPQHTFIIVAHKGFIRNNVLLALGFLPRLTFGNLDTLIATGDLSHDGSVQNVRLNDLPWRGKTYKRTDQCTKSNTRKITRAGCAGAQTRRRARVATRRRHRPAAGRS